MIPYGKHEITQEDIDEVISVLKSNFLTQGTQVPLFEKALSDYADSQYAVAVNSATSALHIACLAIGLKQGDWLWTSAITFVASANCGLYCGANIDFVDIDPESFNIDPDHLESKLRKAKKDGKLPKVLVNVHLCGQPTNLERIYKLSKEFGFKIIEDASHAVGSSYQDKTIGNCEYSDITVFSFHPVKIITTAEGGVALTNNEIYADKMRLLRTHGITKDKEKMLGDIDGPWVYHQLSLGFNYRMSDLHAVLGVSQLKRVDDYVSRRREIASKYNDQLTGLDLKLPKELPDSQSSFHLYVIRLDTENSNKDHLYLYNELQKEGIGVNIHYMPVYRQPYYKKFAFRPDDFPNAELYYKQAISLPIFPTLSEKKQEEVINIIKKVMES